MSRVPGISSVLFMRVTVEGLCIGCQGGLRPSAFRAGKFSGRGFIQTGCFDRQMMPEAVGSVRRLLLSTSAKSPMHSPRPDLHQKVGLCEVGLDLGEKVPKYPISGQPTRVVKLHLKSGAYD